MPLGGIQCPKNLFIFLNSQKASICLIFEKQRQDKISVVQNLMINKKSHQSKRKNFIWKSFTDIMQYITNFYNFLTVIMETNGNMEIFVNKLLFSA